MKRRGQDQGLATIAAYGTSEGLTAYLAKDKARQDRRTRTLYGIISDLNLGGASVLDVGCGPGGDMAHFAGMGANVRGIDACEAMVTEAQARHPEFAGAITTGRVDLESGLGQGGFDLVWCCACLLHVPAERLGTAVTNLVAATKPGGRLVITTKEAGPTRDTDIGAPRLMENHSHTDVLVHAMRRMRLERLERGFIAPSGNTFYSMRLQRFEDRA